MIKYIKKINGNMYVVEAVPETKAKKIQIVSAYMTKSKKEVAPVKDIEDIKTGSTQSNVRNALDVLQSAADTKTVNDNIVRPQSYVLNEVGYEPSADAQTTNQKYTFYDDSIQIGRASCRERV